MRKTILKRGMTIIELLTVIAMISLLMSLMLPAVQYAREAARRTACSNQLRQIGISVQLHEIANRHLPTNGWGYQWTGYSDAGFGAGQPGGWVFATLPYREGNDIYMCARSLHVLGGADRSGTLLGSVDSILICPSRRVAALYPYTEPSFPLRNAVPVKQAAKTDYAINAGDFLIHGKPGPLSAAAADVNAYSWPNIAGFNGVSFVRTTVLLGQLSDGTSHTILVGEKYLGMGAATTGTSFGDDQACYLGDDADNRRWTSFPPVFDAAGSGDIGRFGSSHPEGCQFVMCDGSVRFVPYNIHLEVFANLGNRQDGNVNGSY